VDVMTPITTVEELQIAMEDLRKQQQLYATYTQEQVDEIFRQAALAANNHRIP